MIYVLMTGAVIIFVLLGWIWQLNIKLNKKSEHCRKMNEFYWILVPWLSKSINQNQVSKWFIKKSYKNIAIYGYKEIGRLLFQALQNSEIKVKYIIDANADNMYEEVEVVTSEDIQEEVDVIIVTAPFYFQEIYDTIKNKVNCPIVSIVDVINTY